MMAEIRRLGVSVEALAALGADLRLLQDGDGSGDPQVRALVRDAVRAIDPRWLDRIDTEQAALALAFVQTVFRQALDLLDNPARAPGWRYRDPAVLQAQGQLSRQVARGIDALASQRPKLSAMLLRPGAVLDVGTGVGWLAAERLLAFDFEQIEVFSPALPIRFIVAQRS